MVQSKKLPEIESSPQVLAKPQNIWNDHLDKECLKPTFWVISHGNLRVPLARQVSFPWSKKTLVPPKKIWQTSKLVPPGKDRWRSPLPLVLAYHGPISPAPVGRPLGPFTNQKPNPSCNLRFCANQLKGKKSKKYNPEKLTWNTRMKVWKMTFRFNWVIFRFQPLIFHVNSKRWWFQELHTQDAGSSPPGLYLLNRGIPTKTFFCHCYLSVHESHGIESVTKIPWYQPQVNQTLSS